MPNCAICKKSVTTGIVLCGHCAKGLAPYTLPVDLAWFIDQLSEEIVLDNDIYTCAMCAMSTCNSQVSAATASKRGSSQGQSNSFLPRQRDGGTP